MGRHDQSRRLAHQRTVTEPRFRQILAAWLRTLPRTGWAGSNDELWLLLTEVKEKHKFPGTVPVMASGLTRAVSGAAAELAAVGWEVSFPRTAKARLIAFTAARRKGPAA